jgi:Acetyltransferase (GNAT) family.
MIVKKITSESRERVNQFIKDRWYSDDMVVRGIIYDITRMDGFAVFDSSEIIGLITYRTEGGECEIMSLNSLRENSGIGTALINNVIETAAGMKCSKVKLITTNDNIDALRFYQKRGFDLVRLYHNALDVSRKLKPSIPALGNYNIPLKHELELELDLSGGKINRSKYETALDNGIE